jgi:AraC family ethanolamine operon transcriptional activator
MLPPRRTEVASDEVEALAQAQPERGRHYVRLGPGAFAGSFCERSDGSVAVSRESWSSALRVRCNRPASYVAFSVVSAADATTWCGVPLGRASVIEVDRDWELTSGGSLVACSFAVRRDALEEAERQLAGGDPEGRSRTNRVLHASAASQIAGTLSRRIEATLSDAPRLEERASLQSEFLRLAVLLRRGGDPGSERVENPSRRRAAVRRVEAYLDAHESALPSIAELCAVAEVSERTLEYAFREQVGYTLARYLRVRRLNGARRELRDASSGQLRVTDIALRWGFWQLGRFAAEYRALFGELPSETRAGRRALRRPAANIG